MNRENQLLVTCKPIEIQDFKAYTQAYTQAFKDVECIYTSIYTSIQSCGMHIHKHSKLWNASYKGKKPTLFVCRQQQQHLTQQQTSALLLLPPPNFSTPYGLRRLQTPSASGHSRSASGSSSSEPPATAQHNKLRHSRAHQTLVPGSLAGIVFNGKCRSFRFQR